MTSLQRFGIAATLVAAASAIAISAPTTAAAAERCEDPAATDWTEVAPAAAGMDAAKLNDAIAYATANEAQAVRVYRYGCRVGADLLGPVNANQKFQSWSLAKSIVALVFGRAMTRNLIGPDDPLGSLIPTADAAHGAITMRQLLTMTSGLRWNGLRDYNIFMPDRLHEALTVPVEKDPGTYWEYSQSGPALVAEATGNAVGEDFQVFAQRELFGPLGIEPGSWSWDRDSAGHTQGFFGLHMIPDDYARFGELMRNGGVWRGRRLLSKRFVREAITPLPQSGCYGWFIWLNASKPCVKPRVIDRPVSDERDFPRLPADAFQFAGLLGQLVTVFPGEGLVVARFGVDSGSIAGGSDWEQEFYARVLGSIVDRPVELPKPAPDAGAVSREDVDRGFADSLSRPDEILAGEIPPPLPPAGPGRARAALIKLRATRPGPAGEVKIRLVCPRRWPSGLRPRCRGRATMKGARGRDYSIRAGRSRILEFELRGSMIDRLHRDGQVEVAVRARNLDRAQGAVAKRGIILHRR
jgi:CubicO group peptidase (beta-lactamase class C family)